MSASDKEVLNIFEYASSRGIEISIPDNLLRQRNIARKEGRTNRNSGLGIGVGNSPQGNFAQSSVDVKIEELVKEIGAGSKDTRAEMLSRLEKAGVKYNPEDVVFVTKDKTGQLVWLEKGNEEAGLKHIEKHAGDFAKKHGIPPNELTNHIEKILTNGEIVSSEKKLLSNGRIGLKKIYCYEGKYYVLAAIGTNGFVVSMYPLDEGDTK